MPTGSGPARQLTRHEGSDMFPVWSADGGFIAFESDRNGPRENWFVSPTGGESRYLTAGGRAQWSPDGKWLYSFQSDGLYRAPLPEGEPEFVTQIFTSAFRWFSPDGSMIYGIKDREILAVAPDGQNERQVTDLSTGRGRMLLSSFSTDGQFIYFAWTDPVGDIWVMDVTWE